MTAPWMRRFTVSDDCWEWTGPKDHHGYGRLYANRREHRAHRFIYETLVGAIPAGLDLDHLCRNRGCVSPHHLEPVTHRENLLRGRTVINRHANKTHCDNGHAYTPENAWINKAGWRVCRICKRAKWMRWYYRNKERRLAVSGGGS